MKAAGAMREPLLESLETISSTQTRALAKTITLVPAGAPSLLQLRAR